MTGGIGVAVMTLVAVVALAMALMLLLRLRRAQRDADQDYEVARRRIFALIGADGVAWPQQVSPADVVETACRALGDDGVAVERAVQKTRPLPVRLARDLTVVLTELVDNALAFSDPEEVRVAVRQTNDGSVVLEVDDAGEDPSKDDLKEAGRVLRSSTPPSPDDGLGLFLAGRLAARHGVRVALTARESGVRATVTVPANALMSRPAESSGAATGQMPAATAPMPAATGQRPAVRPADAARAAAAAVARLDRQQGAQAQPGQPIRQRPSQARPTVRRTPAAPQPAAPHLSSPATAYPPPTAQQPPTPPAAAPRPSAPPSRPGADVSADVTASWTPPWGVDGPTDHPTSAGHRPPSGIQDPPPLPSRKDLEDLTPVRRPAVDPLPPRRSEPRAETETSPIFDQVASSWFDEPKRDSAPQPEPRTFSSPADEAWSAAQRVLGDQPTVNPGELPRRDPLKRLVPGSVSSGATRPFRMTRPEGASNPGAWASYQDRVDEVRRSWGDDRSPRGAGSDSR